MGPRRVNLHLDNVDFYCVWGQKQRKAAILKNGKTGKEFNVSDITSILERISSVSEVKGSYETQFASARNTRL
jgi:hypothetical protein